jgi:hypothetical protein
MPVKFVIGTVETKVLNPEAIPRNHHNMDFQVELSKEEYKEYLHASNRLHSFNADAQLFTLVLWNYQEYYNIVDSSLEAFARMDRSFIASATYLDVNRAMLNLLASVRTYLDHTATNISEKYGKDSENFKNYEKYTKEAYDTNFSYRFLYRLRNYSQHRGLPLDHIKFTAEPSKENPKVPFFRMVVGVTRDKALANYDGWSKVRAELANMPPVIEIEEHIDNYMRGIEKISEQIRIDEFRHLRESAEFLRGLLDRVSGESKQVEVFEMEVEENEQGKVTKLLGLKNSPFPVEIVEAVINNRPEDLVRKIEIFGTRKSVGEIITDLKRNESKA